MAHHIYSESVASKSSALKNESSTFRNVREILESFAIALVLVFTIKAFFVELFIIPTGSMAPTLRGFHKEATCPVCGAMILVSASEEFPDASRSATAQQLVLGGVCGNCRFPLYLGKDNPQQKNHPSFKGDRILVKKYRLGWCEPARWDVTVLRYPATPQISYIKRLVGLPNETVRIEHGNIFVRRENGNYNGDINRGEFVIQRKPLSTMLALLQNVYDANHADYETRLRLPPRWRSVAENILKAVEYFNLGNPAAQRGGDMVEGEASSLTRLGSWTRDGNSFRISGANSGAPATLAYHHTPLTSQESLAIFAGEKVTPRAQLITDFNDYNTGISSSLARQQNGSVAMLPNPFVVPVTSIENGVERRDIFCYADPTTLGLNWVSDLAISCSVRSETDAGKLTLSLVKGGTTFCATLDFAARTATLAIPEVPEFSPVTVAAPISSKRNYQKMLFANIDEEMRLVIDGKEINFVTSDNHRGGKYSELCSGVIHALARDRDPTTADLTPAAITAAENLVAEISDLKLDRDIYYIAAAQRNGRSERVCDLFTDPFRALFANVNSAQGDEWLARVFASPLAWQQFGKTRRVEFTLQDDEFLLLGDNSARSKDSRLWTEDAIPSAVPRDLLIGEAVFVYWPHGLLIPFTSMAIIPNFPQMRLIH